MPDRSRRRPRRSSACCRRRSLRRSRACCNRRRPPLPDREGGPPVTIRSVEITGATEYTTAELAQFYAGVVNQTVPQDRVANVVRDIQTKYRNDGYFLTVVRGAIEPADAGPVLRVRVIEGFISDVKIEGDIGSAGVLVYRFLEKLTRIRPANISDVERALLLVQGIPGVSARAVLRPGPGEVGAVELIAQVGRKSFGGVANYDNRGSTYAGTGELLISADANSFTSLGERTELTVFDTPWNDEQVFAQLSTEAFIGSDGLKVRGYYGQGLSEPGSFLAATGFKSHLILAGISASYPIIRTRPLSVTSNLAFDASRSVIDEFGADNIRDPQSITNLRILRAGGDATFQDDTFSLGQIGANSCLRHHPQGDRRAWIEPQQQPAAGAGRQRHRFPEVHDGADAGSEPLHLQRLPVRAEALDGRPVHGRHPAAEREILSRRHPLRPRLLLGRDHR